MAGANLDSWVMASVPLRVARGPYQTDVVGMLKYGVIDGTQKRDVSEVLDLLALADTPFINRVGWGPESGGSCIEWISEDLGPGYIRNLSAVASGVLASIFINSIDGYDSSYVGCQIHAGTILYHYNSGDSRHVLGVVTSEPAMATIAVSIVVSYLVLGVYLSNITSVFANENWYVLGNVQNEGSTPGYGKPRPRVLCSNGFTILRQDVAITGTMKETDMYVIGREDKHQIMLRMKEMQRERERLALYSRYSAKTSLAAGLMHGVFGFLVDRTGTHIDRSTESLTESAFNTVVSYIWERGGRNLSVFGHINQTAKFTRWDKNRIRMRINDRRGGGYITSYLTEAGIEVDLTPMGNVPTNLLFVVDPNRIKLRAKRNRKAIMEKLGKMGDFDDWQLISEFSMEMKGFNLGQHGMFTHLA